MFKWNVCLSSIIIASICLSINVAGKCEDEGCDAYMCFDKKAQCGVNGYLIEFGKKYCERFQQNSTIARFDEAGQVFLRCTTLCLIHEMELYVDNSTSQIDCENLSKTAFESHVKCYLKCNFCTVCKSNKLALLKSYDITDFFGLEAIKQVWKIIDKCGIFACF